MQKLHVICSQHQRFFFINNIEMVIQGVSLTQLSVSHRELVLPLLSGQKRGGFPSVISTYSEQLEAQKSSTQDGCLMQTDVEILVSFVLGCQILHLPIAPCEPQTVGITLQFVHSKQHENVYFLFIFQSFGSYSGTALI